MDVRERLKDFLSDSTRGGGVSLTPLLSHPSALSLAGQLLASLATGHNTWAHPRQTEVFYGVSGWGPLVYATAYGKNVPFFTIEESDHVIGTVPGFPCYGALVVGHTRPGSFTDFITRVEDTHSVRTARVVALVDVDDTMDEVRDELRKIGTEIRYIYTDKEILG